MRHHLCVVVFGTMGHMPLAGMAWQVLQYLEGLRRLGCEVYYVEDTGTWPYNPEHKTVSADCRSTLTYLASLMARCGLEDRWAYRAAAPNGRTFGLSQGQLTRLLERADALVNLTGATVLREEYLRVPVRIYLETDPVLAQVQVAQGDQRTIDLLGTHTHHFTFGENIGAPDCGVPLTRFDYQPTRQPIVLDWWTPQSPHNGHFTTIANWRQSEKDLAWNGETYRWSKHYEFLKFIDLPGRTSQALELALACGDAEALRLLRSHGWHLRDALTLSEGLLAYREYILGSRGEFTVAKDQNIRLRSGWFSDRSACYLGAGRPVITQDTGFGKILPTGKGLFAFRTMDQILDALEQITADYSAHAQAAHEIAREYFSAERVVSTLLERAGL